MGKLEFLTFTVLTVVSVAQAMPTNAEIKGSAKVVREIMGPVQSDTEKTRSEKAKMAVQFASESKSEAEKLLLLKGALGLFVKDGNLDEAVKTVMLMRESIADIPPDYLEGVLGTALRDVPRSAGRDLYRILDDTRVQVKAQQEVKSLVGQLRKTPDDKALRRRLGERYAITGDWAKALKEFAQLGARMAAIAKGEQTQDVKQFASYADYWWNYDCKGEDVLQRTLRAHAANLYDSALKSNALEGLEKRRAEVRIAESRKSASPLTSMDASGVKDRYCVIDLDNRGSGNAQFVYLPDVPVGGWTNEHKTKKLVFRKIEPGALKLGGRELKVDEPYYIGIFELTQGQSNRILGQQPPEGEAALHPVTKLTPIEYQRWHVNALNNWKGLRAAEFSFGLPEEDEWEYAARAGSTGRFALRMNGEEGPLELMDWFGKNEGDSHKPVGLKEPTAYGLYDVHGNVMECCVNKNGEGKDAYIRHGGNYGNMADACAVGNRNGSANTGRYPYLGARLVFRIKSDPTK